MKLSSYWLEKGSLASIYRRTIDKGRQSLKPLFSIILRKLIFIHIVQANSFVIIFFLGFCVLYLRKHYWNVTKSTEVFRKKIKYEQTSKVDVFGFEAAFHFVSFIPRPKGSFVITIGPLRTNVHKDFTLFVVFT